MNILIVTVVLVMPVCGGSAMLRAEGTNTLSTESGDPISVARSGSFEGLHVELQYYENGHWGCVTNGMMLAEVCRDDTNDIRDTDLVVPAQGQAVLVSLRDDSGNVVPPKKGAKFHAPPPTLALPLNGHVNQRIHGCPHQLDWFCVDSLYVIKDTGEYEVEAAPRFYRWTGPKSAALPLITNFPSVKIRLHLTRNASSNSPQQNPP